jgi:hypothetical protein
MPIEYVLDRARHRLTIVGRDPVGEPDGVEWLERQAVDAAWAYGALVDLRLVAWNPTTEEIRRILRWVVTLSVLRGPRGPVAVVATQPALFGMLIAHQCLVLLVALVICLLRFAACASCACIAVWATQNAAIAASPSCLSSCSIVAFAVSMLERLGRVANSRSRLSLTSVHA